MNFRIGSLSSLLASRYDDFFSVCFRCHFLLYVLFVTSTNLSQLVRKGCAAQNAYCAFQFNGQWLALTSRDAELAGG